MYWSLTYLLRAFLKCLVILDSAEPFIFKTKIQKKNLFVDKADRLVALTEVLLVVAWLPVFASGASDSRPCVSRLASLPMSSERTSTTLSTRVEEVADVSLGSGCCVSH